MILLYLFVCLLSILMLPTIAGKVQHMAKDWALSCIFANKKTAHPKVNGFVLVLIGYVYELFKPLRLVCSDRKDLTVAVFSYKDKSVIVIEEFRFVTIRQYL